jgi:hypothetical protein
MTTQNLNVRPRTAHIIPIAASVAGIALATVLAISAFGGWGGGGNGGIAGPPSSPTPSPTADPIVEPTPVPTPVQTPVPTPVQTGVPTPVAPIKVDLITSNGANVYVDIADRTGWLVSAKSGTPAEGMSVAPYTIEVENLDATTLKLTWVDFPIDNALALYIDESEGGLRLVLVQPEPTGSTDSIAHDRELILSFSQPIAADDVETFLQDGLDTAG